MALIKTLKDKLGNIIYPRTKEKAIYDDDDIRLDNKLLAMKNPVTSSADGTWTNDLNTFMDLNKLVGINPENGATLNSPVVAYGKAVNIGFANSVFNQYIYIQGGTTLVRKYTYWEVPQWGAWRKLITEADIIQTDTVNNTTQVPSSAVTYALGQEIDQRVKVAALSASVACVVGQTGYTFNLSAYSNIKAVTFELGFPVSTWSISSLSLHQSSTVGGTCTIVSSVEQSYIIHCIVYYTG